MHSYVPIFIRLAVLTFSWSEFRNNRNQDTLFGKPSSTPSQNVKLEKKQQLLISLNTFKVKSVPVRSNQQFMTVNHVIHRFPAIRIQVFVARGTRAAVYTCSSAVFTLLLLAAGVFYWLWAGMPKSSDSDSQRFVEAGPGQPVQLQN